jgi:hypothetical protein
VQCACNYIGFSCGDWLIADGPGGRLLCACVFIFRTDIGIVGFFFSYPHAKSLLYLYILIYTANFSTAHVHKYNINIINIAFIILCVGIPCGSMVNIIRYRYIWPAPRQSVIIWRSLPRLPLIYFNHNITNVISRSLIIFIRVSCIYVCLCTVTQ